MANRLLDRVSLAGTGIDVPYAVVGTMMFGKRADDQESRRIVDQALDLGLNFFDTADMYQDGESERLLGKALGTRRGHCIIATKVGYGKGENGGEEGTSRTAIMRAIDLSLARLGTDYIDIYYLHRPDYVAPVDETVGAMVDLIRAGKVRHYAISNFGAWQSYQLLHMCDDNGWPRPVMTQMIYNMLVRQLDHEYVRFCKHFGLHLTVYNPLAGGLLTGKYTTLADENAGGRFVNNEMYRKRYWSRRFMDAALGLRPIADSAGMTLTHLAINWIAQQQTADSLLLGPSSAEQLLDCVAAGEATVTGEALERISAFLADFDGTNATYAR